MKICRILFLLLTTTCWLAGNTVAQTGSPTARIVTLNLDPQIVNTLELRPGFVTSVKMPEAVNSVVLGDPASFKAEHSDAEPQLVFFKPITNEITSTNALITTRNGHEVSLSLISEGKSEKVQPIDYVLKYAPARSFVIDSEQPSFLIQPTLSAPDTEGESHPTPPTLTVEEDLLIFQEKSSPHWEGRQLRTSVGPSESRGDDTWLAFSVLNASSRTIELLPPQVALTDSMKKNKHRPGKGEPIPVKKFSMTTRRLAPGERADGIVTFTRPPFKASTEHLTLSVAQADQVDHPKETAISFVSQEQ
jgi:hypothetical protein